MTDSQDRELTLRCTGKVLNRLSRATGKPNLASLSPSDDDWYVNLLWLDRRKCLLITHAATLFSVLAGDVRQADLNQIGPLFGRADPARAWCRGFADRHLRTARSSQGATGDDRQSERPGLHERYGVHLQVRGWRGGRSGLLRPPRPESTASTQHQLGPRLCPTHRPRCRVAAKLILNSDRTLVPSPYLRPLVA